MRKGQRVRDGLMCPVTEALHHLSRHAKARLSPGKAPDNEQSGVTGQSSRPGHCAPLRYPIQRVRDHYYEWGSIVQF
jgi:hypothetical protein